MTHVSRTTLQLAMSAALATRSASTLRHLLDSQGSFVFATALASHTGRQMADILSMLALAQRADVYRRLSLDDRLRLAHAGMADPAGDRRPACPANVHPA
jgi:hypothetical protein